LVAAQRIAGCSEASWGIVSLMQSFGAALSLAVETYRGGWWWLVFGAVLSLAVEAYRGRVGACPFDDRFPVARRTLR
jgi:hypothetical protein